MWSSCLARMGQYDISCCNADPKRPGGRPRAYLICMLLVDDDTFESSSHLGSQWRDVENACVRTASVILSVLRETGQRAMSVNIPWLTGVVIGHIVRPLTDVSTPIAVF
jgi:hypothetical protein